MFFERVYDKSLAQASYIIGCQQSGEALVIDPKRDVDTYLDIARAHKLKITHVAETHIHADFLCGSRELAALTGATLYLSDEGGPDWQYEFPHHGLKDGDSFMLGNLKIEVIHTPGHTPESICFILTDLPASDKPVMIFTGDFVFVGDVGRPDLLEKAAGLKGTMELGARQMFESIKKFKQLPGYLQLWPGHGAGSACGKSLGDVPVSTSGYEMLRNPALLFSDSGQLSNYLLQDQPEPPKYFSVMKRLNKVTRPLLTEIPRLKKLNIADLKTALASGLSVIDTRKKSDYAKGFIPGSINIQNGKSFPTWMGWFVSYDKPFVLIATETALEDLTRKLMRVGLDNVLGYFSDLDLWVKEGGKLDKVNNITSSDLSEILKKNHTQIIDLRSAVEYKKGHVPGAENIFVGDLKDNLSKVNKDTPVVIHCQSGDRSAIGYSILHREGFRNVLNFAGGISEWKKS